MFTVRIWDLPTRFFHWALVLSVMGLVITGNVGGNAMAWHFRLGYLVLSLVLFRLVWGVFGGHWSRWAQLPIHPSSIWAHIKGRTPIEQLPGHNPLGSWSVLTLLLLLSIQVASGLVSDDEIANMGPLSSLVSAHWVSWATAWHKGLGKIGLISLVLIHVLAIVWYRLRKKQALVSAMWHGDKVMAHPVMPSRDTAKTRALALALFCMSALAVGLMVSLGS
jgi:cytochrome b